MNFIQRLFLIFLLFFVYAIADVNYLIRLDQLGKEQERTIELENHLADLKVLHSKLYNYDIIREKILNDEDLGFRPAEESEIIRWSP